MALQIANSAVIQKIEALARKTGLNKTASIERAVDALLAQSPSLEQASAWDRFDAILDQLDRIPEAPTPAEPLAWDEFGLPR
jgi:antitoxin VapB